MNLNRAQRRSIQRQIGQHRAESKHGRRKPLRPPPPVVDGVVQTAPPLYLPRLQGEPPETVPVQGRRLEQGPGGLTIVRYDGPEGEG